MGGHAAHPRDLRADKWLQHYRADDGPVYLVLLIVGHLVGMIMLAAWRHWTPDPVLLALASSLLSFVLSLMLPQWAMRMHGLK